MLGPPAFTSASTRCPVKWVFITEHFASSTERITDFAPCGRYTTFLGSKSSLTIFTSVSSSGAKTALCPAVITGKALLLRFHSVGFSAEEIQATERKSNRPVLVPPAELPYR